MGFQYLPGSAAHNNAASTVLPTFVSVPVIKKPLPMGDVEGIERQDGICESLDVVHGQPRRKRQAEPLGPQSRPREHKRSRSLAESEARCSRSASIEFANCRAART